MSKKRTLLHGLERHLTEGRTERALQVERTAIDEEARTAVLAFASESPYERWWGMEILDCTATSMRQGRLRGGANLLCDHDWKDVVGVIESVEIGADRVGRAVVRFGKSARAEEVWQDVKDGIRRNVSVGYMVHKAVLVESNDGQETYRVTDWEPFEISLVSVPADTTVGIGRSLGHDGDDVDPEQPDTDTKTDTKTKENTMPGTVETPVQQRNHAAEISAIGSTFSGGAELALSAIQRGLTVEQFQGEMLKKMASSPVPNSDIGLDKKEIRRFSIMRALHALAHPGDVAAQRAAAFERECSDAAAAKLGKQARGFLIPMEVQQRDMVAGTPTSGGNLVATNLLSGSFIDVLRNALVLPGLGAQMLTGLVGNIAIPKQTGAATAYWVAESGSPTESQQTIGQVTMAPKTVGAFTDISRKLLLQSSIDVESLVQRDLASVLGLAIQQAAISGTGLNNQPTGLLNLITPSVAGGTDGAAPTWANIVELESDVAVANALVDNMAYLTNAKVRGNLKTSSKVSGQNGFIWDDGNTPLNGYRAAVTNAVPSNLTKGAGTNLSAILFGNFSDLIVGMWGSLDLMVDPYSNSTSGTVRVVALQDVDVAVRYIESFATMVDAVTA